MVTSQTEKLAAKAAEAFSFTFDQIKAKSCVARISNARNSVYYILHKYYGVSLNDICTLFGRTNREICYRLNNVKAKVEANPAFRKRLDNVVNQINNKL